MTIFFQPKFVPSPNYLITTAFEVSMIILIKRNTIDEISKINRFILINEMAMHFVNEYR